MHILKYTKQLIFLLFLLLVAGNNSLLAQTRVVHLDEVEIRGFRKSATSNDLYTIKIDTILKTKYFGADLSQILKNETNLNITQYGGQGSLASIRLKGSAPSQTQINWNGIPVNSPTTGSIDLSLLAGGMADAIEIAYGASGSLFGNGTFGGSINLFNKPDWENRLSVNLAGEAGSWNHQRAGISLRTGTDRWQVHLSGLYQLSPNTYRFHNSFKNGNPLEYRKNDSLNLMVFQPHFFIRLKNNWFIQYGAWWHNRTKQLPSSMSSAPAYTSYQNDESVRQFVRVTKWFKKSSLEMVAAYFTDSLFYSEKVILSDSLQKSSGFRSSDTYMSLFHRWLITGNLTLENGADFEYQTARVQAYNGFVRETRGALFSCLKLAIKQFSADISYRQVFYSMTGPKPIFSLAFQYRLPYAGLAVKGQASNKFRFPTLNDRYWQPGGNRELLPETGMGYDIGLVWKSATPSNSSLSVSSLLYIQHINNWIQWVPAGTYWSPQNIRQVTCRGLELDLTGRWNLGQAGLIARTMYTYTESFDMGLPYAETRYQRQLAYVPFHMLRIQTGINSGRFEATFGYKYMGRRFTTDDHDPWLDLAPCHLADFTIRYSIVKGNNRIVISGFVDNLFDTSYQLVRAYPAPGRSFCISVNYLFNQKNAKND